MATGRGLGRARRVGRGAPAQGPEGPGGGAASDPRVGRHAREQAHHRRGPGRPDHVPRWLGGRRRHNLSRRAAPETGPGARRGGTVMTARRYRLRLATWTVVREPGAPSPRTLSSPAAVAE